VINKCYFYGQAFNKGGWYNEELVELGEELDTNKITLNCSDVEGWLVCSSLSYEGLDQEIPLTEDSTGSSQTCCVREGWQNPKKQSKKDADKNTKKLMKKLRSSSNEDPESEERRSQLDQIYEANKKNKKKKKVKTKKKK